MYTDDYAQIAKAAKTKLELWQRNPIGYFLSAMLAGLYIGFGILLIYTIGGMLGDLPFTKIVMGLAFGAVLGIVVVAGSELFTGNNFIMTGGWFNRTINLSQVLKLWLVCYIGNWTGAAVLALVFHGAGLNEGAVAAYITQSANLKMNLPFAALFLRGVLCNILICLAVWCAFRGRSETGKLGLIFWCLFAFVTCGFEQSVANMTLLTTALLGPVQSGVDIDGYFYNIGVVTLGNIAGGVIFVALPYYLISRPKENKNGILSEP